MVQSYYDKWFNILFFGIDPFVVYYSFLKFGAWDSFYSITSICGFVVGLYKRRIGSSLKKVISLYISKFLFICNKYKAYYQNSKNKYVKYNTYSKSTQLSAGMFPQVCFNFFFNVNLLNKSYNFFYSFDIPTTSFYKNLAKKAI